MFIILFKPGKRTTIFNSRCVVLTVDKNIELYLSSVNDFGVLVQYKHFLMKLEFVYLMTKVHLLPLHWWVYLIY